MYYIYLPFVLILSGVTFFECHRRKLPKWWGVAVLAAPVVTPYFMFRSLKIRGAIPHMIFFFSLMAVAGSELYLYLDMKEKMKYSHLPPIIQQVARFSDTLKSTTIELDKALVTLEKMSKVESRISDLKQTVDFIGKIRTIMSQNQNVIRNLVKFTTDYKTYFAKKNLNWVYHIQLFYTNRNVINHYASLEQYLNDFNALLVYSYKNFDNIKKAESRIHLKNYDEYYLRYRRSVDSHNRLNVNRIEFQNSFLLKYPDIKPYLPGERQTETFRLWE